MLCAAFHGVGSMQVLDDVPTLEHVHPCVGVLQVRRLEATCQREELVSVLGPSGAGNEAMAQAQRTECFPHGAHKRTPFKAPQRDHLQLVSSFSWQCIFTEFPSTNII